LNYDEFGFKKKKKIKEKEESVIVK